MLNELEELENKQLQGATKRKVDEMEVEKISDGQFSFEDQDEEEYREEAK